MIKQGEYLYTTQQVKQGEQQIAQTHGIELFELMERAGKAVFDNIERLYPKCKSLHLFCGHGNNGGDGYVVARIAREKGYRVLLSQVGDPDTLCGEAKQAKDAWLASGGEITQADQNCSIESDLIVDALLGTGFTAPLREEYVHFIQSINASGVDVISIDIPSGLSADTGTAAGECIKARHTVSFIGLKRGLFTGKAAAYTGKVIFEGLDIAPLFESEHPSDSLLMTDGMMKSLILKRSRVSHKGQFGRVLCLGGDRGMFGAIRLAAEASMRVGAGLTRVVTQPENVSALVGARPEIMVYDWRGNSNEINEHLEWADAIALGPGAGKASWGRSLVGYTKTVEKPIVLDADGLNLLAKSPDFNNRRVITPHPGEAARLLSTTTEQVESDRFSAARKLQLKYGGVVVLKGIGTIVCDGKCAWVCNSGNPGMSTGGMGDVLTGIIAGLIAQGYSLSEAAKLGTWVHSKAADISAQKEGEIGLLASDLFPYVRLIMNHKMA